jgi:transcription antitermination factor NusG
MPFLPDEPVHSPDDLFNSSFARTGPAVWWVAHTKPRQEKAIARHLLKIGFPYYLPCERKRVLVGKKVRTVNIPVFDGYIFLMATEDLRWRAMASNRVASLQRVVDQERFWTDLERVRSILDLGKPVESHMRLPAGTPVTLRDGPMAGMTGVVEKAAGAFKFVVLVEFLQRSLSVTVDGEWLGLPQAA